MATAKALSKVSAKTKNGGDSSVYEGKVEELLEDLAALPQGRERDILHMHIRNMQAKFDKTTNGSWTLDPNINP